MPNPVRIYVLHHPESKKAEKLTNHIFDWFRLTNREGIPVYLRSKAAAAQLRVADLPRGWPLRPYGLQKPAPVIEYLVPLVDANMVRDPLWHDYLADLAGRCEASEQKKPSEGRGVLFPVSLDPTAFNLPRVITRRNFIRHGGEGSVPVGDTEAQEQAQADETLKHLTEALARDLDARVFRKHAARESRMKIFISYARADGTEIAKALRDYIQSKTQCLAFLDENAIAYGQPFDRSLKRNVDDLARAMIVVNSDHYADRSWCRWEIEQFTAGHVLHKRALVEGGDSPPIHFYHPLLVVDAVNGKRVTRVVPELAQCPMIRWDEQNAQRCFSVLMREVVLGLRDVRVAEQVAKEENRPSRAIFVNRLPGPVAIEKLLSKKSRTNGTKRQLQVIRYPGYGMSLIELRLLRNTFRNVCFRAFRDVVPLGVVQADGHAVDLKPLRQRLLSLEASDGERLPLRGKVLAISTAHCAEDLAAIGALPQHQDEALIHLLRPLIRLGVDLYYGGLPPKEAANAPSATRNITAALLRLVSEERREEPEDGAKRVQRPRGSLLFNVCAWPRYQEITAEEEASWISSYRIRRFDPKETELGKWPRRLPAETEEPPFGYLRHVALTISAVRQRLGEGFEFDLPEQPGCIVKPDAYIFMGGKTSDFSGIMPGIMEEFLHAVKTCRPIYLFGGLGGAAGVIAGALCARKGAARPEELKVEYYRKQPVKRAHNNFAALIEELKRGDPQPDQLFAELWSLIKKHRKTGLEGIFNNGLSASENQTLITTHNTLAAVQLAWKGMCAKLL